MLPFEGAPSIIIPVAVREGRGGRAGRGETLHREDLASMDTSAVALLTVPPLAEERPLSHPPTDDHDAGSGSSSTSAKTSVGGSASIGCPTA